MVINEALACGVPVLTTDAVGAAPDVIRDGENGYIVRPANPAALQDALLTFFSSSTDRAAMGEAARRVSESLTFAAQGDAFVDAAECALAQRA